MHAYAFLICAATMTACGATSAAARPPSAAQAVATAPNAALAAATPAAQPYVVLPKADHWNDVPHEAGEDVNRSLQHATGAILVVSLDLDAKKTAAEAAFGMHATEPTENMTRGPIVTRGVAKCFTENSTKGGPRIVAWICVRPLGTGLAFFTSFWQKEYAPVLEPDMLKMLQGATLTFR